MKKSLILILIITAISACILIFAIRAAHSYTFEGELDPDVFTKWPRVSQGMVTPVIGKVMVQNPDISSPIQKVEMFIYIPLSVLTAYRYFKHGEIYQYKLDIKANRYVRKHLTDHEKKGCMKCHKKRPVSTGRSVVRGPLSVAKNN